MKKKILFIFGTRPEAIKLAPLILAMYKDKCFTVIVCVTGQHRSMLHQILKWFNIVPDVDLDLMQNNQGLSGLTSILIGALAEILEKTKPDYCIVQGDTTTAFAGALVSYYQKIPVIHVEAGLRTYNKYSPFPEEINRTMLTSIADIHFAPTEISKNNLLKENVSADKIFVTGNTVIDALFYTKVRIDNDFDRVVPNYIKDVIKEKDRFVLITSHRRENFGIGIGNICKAINMLAFDFPETNFIYPVHLNPNIQKPVKELLLNINNVHLLEPLDYVPFVALMDKCAFILTDSGGVQEEAPSLGKPILVMRDTTERPEAIEKGVAKLIGTKAEDIYAEAKRLLSDSALYASMQKQNPYGDGNACKRIIDVIKARYETVNN